MAKLENHALAILRKMREDMRSMRAQMDVRQAAVVARLDRIESQGMRMETSFIGNRTMMERRFCSIDQQLAHPEKQGDRLEAAKS
jgi:DNA-binding MarR family transcriptional regulator